MLKLIKNDIKSNKNLPFFAQKTYLNSKSDEFGWFKNKNFILPFILYRRHFFKRLVFTTEVIELNKTTLNKEKEFLNEVISFIKKNKLCDFIDKPQPSAVFRTYPDNCDAFRWGSYILDIEDNFENLLQKIKANQRNYIRKALKDGVEIEKSSNFEEIYSLANNTLQRQKIPLLICKNEFKKQFDSLHPQNMIMFKANYQNNLQGVIVIFFDKKNAFAEYAGSIEKPKKGSIKLLHLTAMQYLAQKHGILTYDFIGAIPDIIEGSKEAGIQRFKKEFGANLKEGYQFKLIINPFKHFLFNLCLKLSFFMKGIEYKEPVKRFKELSKSNLKI